MSADAIATGGDAGTAQGGQSNGPSSPRELVAQLQADEDAQVAADDRAQTRAWGSAQAGCAATSRAARDALPDDGARTEEDAGGRQPTRTKREIAAQYACPRCGAGAGEYCRRLNGRPRLSCHAERHAAALACGAPGAQPRNTQLNPRQGARVTRQGQPEAGARSA